MLKLGPSIKYAYKLKPFYLYIPIIAFLLFLSLFHRLPEMTQLNDWCTTPYTFDYSYGFHSRLLMGTLFKLLLSPISLKRLYLFILASLVILVVLFSVFFSSAIARSNDKSRIGIGYWTLLLMASPASIAFLFYWGNYGRFDLYLLGVMFTALLLVDKKYFNNLVPLLLGIGMAIHQVFIFTYCAVIIGALFYESYRHAYSKASVIRLLCGILITLIAFFYFQFATTPLAFETAKDVVSHMNTLSNIPVNEKMIDYEYFRSISEHLDAFVKIGLKDRMAMGGIVIVLMSPLIVLYLRFWRHLYKSSWRFGFVCLSLLPLASLPAFILTIDWGRWFAAVILASFSLIAYLFKRQEPLAVTFFEGLTIRIKKSPYIYVALLAYMMFLNKFEAAAILSFASKILYFFKDYMV
jgi:hypothetical protein